MQTLIVGRNSNLSQRLAERLDSAALISARRLLSEGIGSVPDEPFQVIINSFQPATRLRELEKPTAYIGVSIDATAMMLESLVGSKCVKVVYTSSASVYGDGVDCREDSVPRIGGLHPALKVANELLIQGFCESQGIDFTITRVFNMYGGLDRFSIISKILDSVRCGTTLCVSNGGDAVRDFIHIDDVVTSYSILLGIENCPIVNVATGVGISISSIIESLRLHGHEVSVTSRSCDEISFSTADVTRLSRFVDVGGFRSVLDHVQTFV